MMFSQLRKYFHSHNAVGHLSWENGSIMFAASHVQNMEKETWLSHPSLSVQDDVPHWGSLGDWWSSWWTTWSPETFTPDVREWEGNLTWRDIKRLWGGAGKGLDLRLCEDGRKRNYVLCKTQLIGKYEDWSLPPSYSNCHPKSFNASLTTGPVAQPCAIFVSKGLQEPEFHWSWSQGYQQLLPPGLSHTSPSPGSSWLKLMI